MKYPNISCDKEWLYFGHLDRDENFVKEAAISLNDIVSYRKFGTEPYAVVEFWPLVGPTMSVMPEKQSGQNLIKIEAISQMIWDGSAAHVNGSSAGIVPID